MHRGPRAIAVRRDVPGVPRVAACRTTPAGGGGAESPAAPAMREGSALPARTASRRVGRSRDPGRDRARDVSRPRRPPTAAAARAGGGCGRPSPRRARRAATTSAAATPPMIAPRPTTPHYADPRGAGFGGPQPASMASKRRVSSSGEPTLMRTEAGSPNGPSGRTITPWRSRRAANAAPSPTSTQRKLATPSSGAKPRSRRPAASRSRPSRVSSRRRATSSPAPRLASAASSADCVTSNAFLTLRQAAATSGGQSP